MEPLFNGGHVKAKVNNFNRLAHQQHLSVSVRENAPLSPPSPPEITPLNKAPPVPMSSATSPHLYRHRSYSHSTNMTHAESTVFQRTLATLGKCYNRFTNKHWRPHQRRGGAGKHWSVRDGVRVRNLVRAMWVLLVWWGERRVFHTAIQDCLWDNWEEWV